MKVPGVYFCQIKNKLRKTVCRSCKIWKISSSISHALVFLRGVIYISRMCYQSFVIFPYDVIATQMNDEWVVWMDAKKRKRPFSGGLMSSLHKWLAGVWVQKGYETKESWYLTIISLRIRKWLILLRWVELKNHPHLTLAKDKILLVMNTSSLNDICQCQVRKHTCNPFLK